MQRILVALAAFALTFQALPGHAQNCAPFTDVLASSSFCSNIQWLHNRAITLGCAPNLYCPADFVRRDQMAAFLNRLGNIVHEQGGNAFGATAVLGTLDNHALDLRANNARVMRYEPGAISPNLIGGHPANSASAGVRGATIAGGGVPASDSDPDFIDEAPNRVTDAYGTVGGGYANVAGDNAGVTLDAPFATVGGGRRNTAGAFGSTVAGGRENNALGVLSTIGGGHWNTVIGQRGTVAGGHQNWAAEYGSVAGGNQNTAVDYAFAAGGNFNNAAGVASFAAGQFANADGHNCAVFSLWGNAPGMGCFGNQSVFAVGALNGMLFAFGAQQPSGFGERWVVFGRVSGHAITTHTGAYLSETGVWQDSSDAERKEAFAEVDKQSVLAKLASLPVHSWRYKGEAEAVRHLGPTAQDFMAAFGLGQDERTIGGVDAQGVALAAIQGLNAKFEAQRSEIEAQRREIAELRRTVGILLRIVPSLDLRAR